MAANTNGTSKRKQAARKIRSIGKTALRYNIGVRFFQFLLSAGRPWLSRWGCWFCHDQEQPRLIYVSRLFGIF